MSAPSASRAREPMLACELEALRQEWRDVQDQITAALDARDLDLAVRLSERCRELDRVVFSQPLSFIQGRRAMNAERSISELAAEAGVAYSTMWKRLNPDRAREWQRADNAKRPNRDRGDRGTCPQCGSSKTAARHSDLCVSCARARDHRSRAERCRRIEQWWAEGLSQREIGTRLGWAATTVGREVNWMRRNGYDLPHRRTPEQIARMKAARWR